jgi:hypothetical protein
VATGWISAPPSYRGPFGPQRWDRSGGTHDNSATVAAPVGRWRGACGSILVIQDIDTWQFIVNTATTIVTFLVTALLQNTQTRNDQSTQDKLNALADAVAIPMTHTADIHDRRGLHDVVTELRDAVGLEDRESS